MAIVRVKNGVNAQTFDHNNGVFVALTPGLEFDSNDPFVKENRWAFETDAEAEQDPDRKARKRVTSVETADANPGAKRNR